MTKEEKKNNELTIEEYKEIIKKYFDEVSEIDKLKFYYGLITALPK